MSLDGFMSLCIEVEVMRINKRLIAIMGLSILATLMVYPSLPEQVAIHWDLQGQVDRMGPKSMVFLLAVLPLGLYALLWFSPKIDPRGHAYKKFTKAYQRFMDVVLLFLVLVHWLTIAWSMGIELPIDQVVKVGLSILFLVTGNYLGQVRMNYTFGIKTPWTLASESVWTKTHRVSSYAFVLGGLLMLVSTFIYGRWGMISFFISLFLPIIFSMCVSYLFYVKEQS